MKVIKAILSFLGIGAGGFSIYASNVMMQMECGSTEWDMMYGGDAYTGIQNAAAQAANNVKDFAELTRVGFAEAFFIIGLLMILYFGLKFFEVLSERNAKGKEVESATKEDAVSEKSEQVTETPEGVEQASETPEEVEQEVKIPEGIE